MRLNYILTTLRFGPNPSAKITFVRIVTSSYFEHSSCVKELKIRLVGLKTMPFWGDDMFLWNSRTESMKSK